VKERAASYHKSTCDKFIRTSRSAKLAPGVLWASVGGDPKSVKHFTGLKKGAFKWVMNALKKAVCGVVFFVLLVSWLCEYIQGVLGVSSCSRIDIY